MDNNPQDKSITAAIKRERQRLAAEAEETERKKAEIDEKRAALAAEKADIEAREKDRLERNTKKRTAVLELCTKFAVWATTNDIPYNYSDRNDKGWLVGSRGGGSEEREVTIWSGYGVSETATEITLYESYRLLVDSDLTIHEVSSSDVVQSRKPPSWRNLFSRSALTEATLESYPVETIVDDIAKFAVAYNVEWLDE